MRRIENLEIHVAHACNLTCESCSHYSNQGHKGVVGLEEAERWMRLWNGRLAPEAFSLVGGEPTVHPELASFAAIARRCWPQSHLRIVTNGLLLHRHPELPKVLGGDTNAAIFLSVHHDAPEYREKMWPVVQLLRQWSQSHGVRVGLYNSLERWTRRYKGFGSAMEPYEDGQPRRSWENCPAKHAPQLLDGKIYKCGPLAYLPLQNERHALSEKWAPYLRYEPLDPTCTDERLAEFFDREEESFCGMCPAQPEKFKLPLPLPKVRVKPASRQSHALPVIVAAPGFMSGLPRPAAKRTLAAQIHRLKMPLPGDPAGGWKRYPLFRGATGLGFVLGCHVSVLSPGVTPHPPHHHDEEELLLMLDGEADLVIHDDRRTPCETRTRLTERQFVYYPAGQTHTIHSPGPTNATYLMFKWNTPRLTARRTLETKIVADVSADLVAQVPVKPFAMRKLIEGPTGHLSRLQSHLTLLQPGAGYKPHTDPYDVAIITLAGTVRTLGRDVEPVSVIYYPAGQPHGMRNVGETPARYMVFEFHD